MYRVTFYLLLASWSFLPDLKGAEPPNFQPGGIFMFGDSTTAPRGELKVYPQRVQAALSNLGIQIPVYNSGVPSNSTELALRRLQHDVLDHHPRLVVMQFGINDSAVNVWESPPATEPRIPLAAFRQNYRSLITQTRDAGAAVIVLTTNPLRWRPKTLELYGRPPYDPAAEDGFETPHLLSYNAAIRDLAEELAVPLIDVHATYPQFAARHQTTVNDLLPDGMHPGELGHQLIAELLVPEIQKLLEQRE